MNVASLGRLIDLSPDGVRQWCERYEAFLSPGATPPKGGERKFNTHDLKVFNYIATTRNSGDTHDKVRETLAKMQADGYTDLPDTPKHWIIPPADGRIAMNEATDHAQELAQFAAMQVQVQSLRERLEESQERADKLERELDNLRTTHSTTEAQLHGVELELERAKADVARFEGEMRQYSFGRDKPINVGFIVIIALTAGAVLVALALVLARLLL